MAAEYDLIISNGVVVTDTEIREYDIAIKGEKIEKVVSWGALKDAIAGKIIDAEGGYVMPGGVDAHVHLDEPPLFRKGSTADNYETGSRSAICGGTTTMVTFAPQKKSEDTPRDTLLETHAKAKDACYMDYSFHLLVGNPSPNALSEFKTLREEAKNVCAKYHGPSHPPMAEIEATYRAISLSEFIDTPILIVHVSTPAAANHIKQAQGRAYRYMRRLPGFEGAKCVCSPPPRESEQDLDGIWNGLANGTFTVLSSDHCPFRYEDNVMGKKSSINEKFPLSHFKYIPNGLSGIETRLALTLGADRLELKKFVEVTGANPAKLYGLWPQKGGLVEGQSDADINIWYQPGKMTEYALKNEMLHHNVDYTPYEGKTMRQWPRYTILRGKVVWDKENGGLLGKK
ncbi:D-hydantoinase [Zopfia rhizophila CBS 207.26]|uniref:D-hydantoinase n=1 Tax=Zopfia rhizophila CBS 207.26 TaxID=1314779 RepID=A0A6A6E1M9_9PEZI|nr:D-hydantoinase [Zopfia rhizophila CBS 207.26]